MRITMDTMDNIVATAVTSSSLPSMLMLRTPPCGTGIVDGSVGHVKCVEEILAIPATRCKDLGSCRPGRQQRRQLSRLAN